MAKIAIVGAGISGLSAAHYLKQAFGDSHQLRIFEQADRVGGHTATVDVHLDGRDYAIDTGFIVYNDWTYPNFIKLLDELGVQSQPTTMGFSVSNTQTGLEWAGGGLDAVFAQRRNLFSPRFLGMLRDIFRFNREAVAELEAGEIDPSKTLGDYLRERRYGQGFIDDYLVPMGAAIWSSGLAAMLDFPLVFFVRFFKNHGLLSIGNRPQWRVIQGGSRSYLGPLCAAFSESIETGADIASIRRSQHGVDILFADGRSEAFDYLLLATHSDQALALLEQPSVAERAILGAIPYNENDVVLHTDASLLPRSEKTWSSWNYRIDGGVQGKAHLTYNMNILQGIESDHTFCVTLNQSDAIDPATILGRFSYAHPEFTLKGMQAQSRWQEIAGVNRTWFCGAYWRNGFHEDGVYSALQAVSSMRGKIAEDEAQRAIVDAAVPAYV